MVSFSRLCLAAAVMGALAPAAFAANLTLTDPSAVSEGAMSTPTTANAAIGAGSWAAPGTTKTEIIISAASLGLGTFTIDDIQSFRWSVNSNHSVDWYLSIYTEPYAGGDRSWYGNRLTFEGLYANNPNFTPGWITFSSAAGTNQVTGYDGNRGGYLGYYGAPTLAQFQAGAIDWDSLAGSGVPSGTTSPIDYGSQVISHFRLSTGSAWATGYTGLLDDFNVTLATGASATVDFEAPRAVPIPAAAYIGMSMLSGLGLYNWRKRKQTAKA
jgi:hypothetical protein